MSDGYNFQQPKTTIRALSKPTDLGSGQERVEADRNLRGGRAGDLSLRSQPHYRTKPFLGAEPVPLNLVCAILFENQHRRASPAVPFTPHV